jgi:hypothetical protein
MTYVPPITVIRVSSRADRVSTTELPIAQRSGGADFRDGCCCTRINRAPYEADGNLVLNTNTGTVRISPRTCGLASIPIGK